MPHHRGHNQSNKRGKKSRKQPNATRARSSLPQRPSSAPSDEAANAAKNGGCYAMYKEATFQFYNWISREGCPHMKMTAVNDYRMGAQFNLGHNRTAYMKKTAVNFIVAPREIMASLASSIARESSRGPLCQ
jgi:hypothetical protein